MTRILALVLTAVFFASPALADKNQKKREEIQQMRQDVLSRLYKEKPSVKDEIAKAEGYAVFSNIGVNVIFFSAGGGSGIVKDMKSGAETYMNMGQAGVGLGIGVKDFRAVFVFHKRDALTNFIESGWDFGGDADAAAKSGEKGGEGSAAATVVNGVSLYQLTETGLAIQATLNGTKYWKSDKLNNQ